LILRAKTGYGKQTKEILTNLIAEGYEIFNIGGIGGETVWGGKIDYVARTHFENGKEVIDVRIPILPTMGHLGGRDVAKLYIQRYDLDLIITLWDCFAIEYTGKLRVPAINYLPIDSPMTNKIYNQVKDSYKIVAYSKFGYNELLKWFPAGKVDWIPHGLYCEKFRPHSEKENRKFKELIIPAADAEECFLILDVAANVGERKQLPFLIEAFARFCKKHDDAYLYLFSNPVMAYPQGYDLLTLADQFGVRDKILYPKVDPILDPWTDEELSRLYSAADVFVSPTIGEGFGVPILEAAACGTPSIVTNCSSMIELVRGHGWLIDTVPEDVYVFVPVWIPNLQRYRVPDMRSLLNNLEKAYIDREKLREYGKMSRKFALKYDWKNVIPLWKNFLNRVEEELQFLKQLGR